MKLTEYLRKKKLTAAKFALEAEVNVATLSRFFNGESMPSTTNVGRILEATGGKVTFDDLVREFGQAEQARA